MPDVEQTSALLATYRDLFARRKASINPAERIRLTHELTELERQIRNAVKTHPVPEPLGKPLLEQVAARMTELGFEIFAVRVTGQHYRHPMSVPFQNLDQLRDYIGAHLTEETLAQIPELHKKKKLWGLL
jgi:hypothetical protein